MSFNKVFVSILIMLLFVSFASFQMDTAAREWLKTSSTNFEITREEAGDKERMLAFLAGHFVGFVGSVKSNGKTAREMAPLPPFPHKPSVSNESLLSPVIYLGLHTRQQSLRSTQSSGKLYLGEHAP